MGIDAFLNLGKNDEIKSLETQGMVNLRLQFLFAILS